MKTRSLGPLGLATTLLLACGGGDGGDPAGGPVSSSCATGARVDVGPDGASPACLRVAPGTAVTFANGRDAALEIRSAPHPTHGSCPELDATPPIPPGGTLEVAMVTEARCAFHDHATGAALGVIQVGAAAPGPDPYAPDPYGG